MGVASVGNVADNFIRMMTWSDPLERSTFVESWTIFYWAWWLALGPFVGMFVAKISRGRTLRQVIFGMLGWGSLGCAVFFIVLGGYALDLELSDAHPVAYEAISESPSAAIASIVELLPLGSFWLAYLAVIGLIFAATTYDSAAYSLAAGTTLRLPSDQDPSRALRVYWAILLGILPVTLLYVGGLTSVQTASVVASVPLLPIYLRCVWKLKAPARHSATAHHWPNSA
jgi:BCCT family betaine/carnitine transporter